MLLQEHLTLIINNYKVVLTRSGRVFISMIRDDIGFFNTSILPTCQGSHLQISMQISINLSTQKASTSATYCFYVIDITILTI